MKESELYEPMRLWLQTYLEEKYKGWRIITLDSHKGRLDRILLSQNVQCDIAVGIDIQIDVLGIALKGDKVRLFFIEAKKTSLTLRDLGQLWAYCKLIDPEEAFLMTSADMGSLEKLINVFNREDLLSFGNGKTIKKMQIALWNTRTGSPMLETMIPKM